MVPYGKRHEIIESIALVMSKMSTVTLLYYMKGYIYIYIIRWSHTLFDRIRGSRWHGRRHGCPQQRGGAVVQRD